MSSGLYIHVPFCVKKCIYCDFYSVARNDLISQFASAVQKEIEYYSTEWQSEKFDTIYFGGGSPSQLTSNDVSEIIKSAYKNFTVQPEAEITLECNPDDISESYVQGLLQAGINRISIGIQTFDNKLLSLLDRRHQADTAIKAINIIHNTGISNISADLIYGLPETNLDAWKENVNPLLQLPLKHISAYMLTVHDNTLLSKKVMTGKITMPDEDLCFSQYEFLISEVEKSGFQQYEISNFALAGFKSKHNIKYWKGYKYLGLGPAAHSYNLHSRAWNISDVESYVNDTSSFILQRVVEELPVKDMYNEFLMNSLRTTEGLNLTELEERFKRYGFCPLDKIEKLKKEWYHKEDNYIRLTTSGMFVSDYIIEKLMII